MKTTLKAQLFYLFCSVFIFTGCAQDGPNKNGRDILKGSEMQNPEEDSLRNVIAYLQAIEATATPEIIKADSNLLTVPLDSDPVYVATWKSTDSYYRNPTTHEKLKNYPTDNQYFPWVTFPKELADSVKRADLPDSASRQLYLEQILGLSPYSGHNYFIVFKVSRKILHRPCISGQLMESCCSPDRKGVNKEWLKQMDTIASDRHANKNIKYDAPFTELGYTYNWNPSHKNHMGLSEFIIHGGDIEVYQIYSTRQFLEHYGVVCR